ncbi:transposase [Trichonephila clavipes]|nr:transposase [Trichonephila clavipes]
MTPTRRHVRFGGRGRVRRDWIATEWNQVVFRDKSRFSSSSDDNRVVLKPRGERLNSATTHHNTFTTTHDSPSWCDATCVATHDRASKSHFSTRQCSATRNKDIKRLPPTPLPPFPGFLDGQICLQLSISRIIWDGNCQVIYSQFGLAIHQNDHQARRRFVEWAQNEIAVPDFHKRILFSDEAHIWLNGYVNKQNCRIWSEANPQVYVETPLHPEKLTVWCALRAGGIIGPYFFKNDEGHNVTVNGDRCRAPQLLTFSFLN